MKKNVVLHSNIKSIIYKLIIILSGVLCWMSAIYNQKLIANSPGTVSVRFPNPTVSEQEIKNILESMQGRKEADIPEVTLWKKDGKVLIRNEDIDKTLTAELVEVAGDMSKVYPGPVLRGGYLPPEDKEGCVIDRRTAYQLFGSEDVVGMELKYIDKVYIIRGILKFLDSNTMIIHEAAPEMKEENRLYNCMELDFSDHINADMLAVNFVRTHGLGEPSAYINSYQYQTLAELLIHLPVWLAVLWLISFLVRKVHSLKYSLILSLTGYLIVAAIGILLIKLADFHISYPSSLIPGRWSDFDFWADKWKEVLGSLKGREGIVWDNKNILLRNRLFYVAAGVLLMIIAERIIMKGKYITEQTR